jgi:hypothetical protein
MGDSDSEGEYVGPRGGHTPFYDAEEGDMKRLLAKTFSPALMASAPGSLVAVTTSLCHQSQRRKYSTLATLFYQGKKWVGGAKGKWKAQEYELLSFRFVRGGLRGSTARFKVGWGDCRQNNFAPPQFFLGGSENARSEERPSAAMSNVCMPLMLRATARRRHSLVR